MNKDMALRQVATRILIASMVCVPAISMAAVGCGDLKDGIFGPFDNRTMPRDARNLVEGAHFTPEVESLRRGHRGTLGGDISYTLRAIPNNPRALLAMSRLGLKLNTDQPDGSKYTVRCYFERAFEMAADDAMPHLIYAIYLKDRKHNAEALEHLATAEKLKPDYASYEFYYNMGLEYFDMGVYDKALENAQLAYNMGAPFPGLRKKLMGAGKWSEPPSSEPSESEPSVTDKSSVSETDIKAADGARGVP